MSKPRKSKAVPASAAAKPASEMILYQTEDNQTRIEVRLKNETVWLTQAQMAELFQTTQQNVSLHIQNIYEEGELTPETTHKESLSVQPKGQAQPTATVIPVTVEQMQAFTAPMYNRNPKLQFAFGGAKLVEGRGFGMRTFGEAAAKHGLPVPKYAFDGLYLNLTIYRHARAAVDALGVAMLDKLSKSERSGWEWLASKGNAKSSEYAAAMKVDDRTARRHLNHFHKLGLVGKTGDGPSTEYQIK